MDGTICSRMGFLCGRFKNFVFLGDNLCGNNRDNYNFIGLSVSGLGMCLCAVRDKLAALLKGPQIRHADGFMV